eukprot:366156-Chlamydomonas_euryale.AAC.8
MQTLLITQANAPGESQCNMQTSLITQANAPGAPHFFRYTSLIARCSMLPAATEPTVAAVGASVNMMVKFRMEPTCGASDEACGTRL